MLVLVAVAASAAAVCAFRREYPFGVRTCCLPCLGSALRAYASEHDGWYPRGVGTPIQALVELYPRYAPAANLAGLSGDISKLAYALEHGEPIADSMSSWTYVPGFRFDDGEVAILWEMRGGLRFNASRASPGSHAVGFADGSHRQVAGGEWDEFTRQQASLRDKILRGRAFGSASSSSHEEQTAQLAEPSAAGNRGLRPRSKPRRSARGA